MELTDLTNENQSHDGRKPLVLDKEGSSGIATAESLPSSPNPPHQHPRRKLILFGLLGIGLTAGAIFGYHWWRYASAHESTDDAYVTSYIHPIDARINGTVVDVEVDDNQQVSQGTLLVKLDPRDYDVARQRSAADLASAEQQAAVAQANISVTATNAVGQTTEAQGNINAAAATVSSAEAALAEAQAGVPAAQAQLAQVKANLIKAELDYKRYTALSTQGAVPQQQADTARAVYESTLGQYNAISEQIKQAQARVVQAQKNLSNAEAKLNSTKGNLQQANATAKQTEVNRLQYKAALTAIAQSKAELKNADLQLSYTSIVAPIAGRIGNKTVQVGQRVQPGQTLMSVVQLTPWIVANFKETQLENMQPGQAVEIKVDAFPHHSFRGKVDSLSPASGAKFALLPPDNATGNFTKIVQRIPVKVVFDPNSIRGYESRITPGMSVVVTVDTQ
ncbi:MULTISPECIES: HlyD family secretion protein [Nostocales]|uniref:HlyD family secretion protein n=3 Tax=Nostocales TaxID=1161 RepID=A0A0C1QWW1_9CYAN|nr:HlyD family secretion protein [Tolypothrix bouteillei]KAF3885834.1 HlyD family secretion protein [Tolypothrix bouteillei VB521301]